MPRLRSTKQTNLHHFIIGDGEMADRIREFNWAKTALGPITEWPQSLLTSVNIVLQSPVPLVMLWGKDGIMIYNDGYSEFAGARHPSLLGSKVLEGWPEVADLNRLVMKKGLQGKTLSYKDRHLVLYRNNIKEDLWCDLNYSPIIDESGKPAGVLAIVVETTGRILAERLKQNVEKDLQNEKDRLKSVLMQAPASIAVTRGENHVYELKNTLYMELIGKKRDIIGKTVREALPELEGQGFYELLDNVFKTGIPYIGNETLVKLDRKGTKKLDSIYVNFVYQPIKDSDGNVESIFVHAVDVTDQVLVKKKIEESEEKYRSLFNTMDQGFCIIEMIFNRNRRPVDYRFVELNPTFEKQIGIHNAIGKTAKELLPHLEKNWLEHFGSVALTGNSTRFTDGSDEKGRWFDIYAFRLGKKDSLRVALLFTDITEQKRYENHLKERENYYREMTDNTPIMTWVTNVKAKCTYLSRPWFEYTGQTSKAALGNGWLKPVHPDDSKHASETFLEAYKSRKAFSLEYRLRRYDGVYRWHMDSGLPKFDNRGIFQGYIGSVVDIHDRKILERQKDDFLGIASHELKTPVTSIKAYGQVLQRMFKNEGNVKGVEHLAKMDAQVNRLSNLIEDLLDVTKIQSGRLQFHEEYFDLNTIINNVVEEIQRTTDKHTIIKKLDKTKKLYGDSERIGQVITNLMTNAIKYSPKSDKINVYTKVEPKSVTLCVQDFGVGIPTDKKEKVFEQFFRVSGPKQDTFPGLGLGLYISSEIIKREGGRIWVESTEGKGSTFCFRLPIRQKPQKKKL